MSERLLNKLKCKCGDYFISKYTDEYLQEKYPYVEGDLSWKSQNNVRKWIKLKRFLICPTCGNKKKISKKLLMKISKMKYERDKENESQ